jgi:hypothetical protein
METDSHAKHAVLDRHISGHAKPEQNRVAGIGNTQHHRITDRLDTGTTSWQFNIHGSTKRVHERDRPLVPVRLGQRRKSSDVSE